MKEFLKRSTPFVLAVCISTFCPGGTLTIGLANEDVGFGNIMDGIVGHESDGYLTNALFLAWSPRPSGNKPASRHVGYYLEQILYSPNGENKTIHHDVEVMAGGGLDAGNIFISPALSFHLRFGIGLEHDGGPPRISEHNSVLPYEDRTADFSYNLFAGL